MEDKQIRYLDKVVEFLVRDAKIDYDRKEIKYPFLSSPSSFLAPSQSFLPLRSLSLPPFAFTLFSTYVKDMYGLTYREIDYVWNIYIPIIKDKINNGR